MHGLIFTVIIMLFGCSKGSVARRRGVYATIAGVLTNYPAPPEAHPPPVEAYQ